MYMCEFMHEVGCGNVVSVVLIVTISLNRHCNENKVKFDTRSLFSMTVKNVSQTFSKCIQNEPNIHQNERILNR